MSSAGAAHPARILPDRGIGCLPVILHDSRGASLAVAGSVQEIDMGLAEGLLYITDASGDSTGRAESRKVNRG